MFIIGQGQTYGSLPAWRAPAASATLILSPLLGRAFSTSLREGSEAVLGPLTLPLRSGVRSLILSFILLLFLSVEVDFDPR